MPWKVYYPISCWLRHRVPGCSNKQTNMDSVKFRIRERSKGSEASKGTGGGARGRSKLFSTLTFWWVQSAQETHSDFIETAETVCVCAKLDGLFYLDEQFNSRVAIRNDSIHFAADSCDHKSTSAACHSRSDWTTTTSPFLNCSIIFSGPGFGAVSALQTAPAKEQVAYERCPINNYQLALLKYSIRREWTTRKKSNVIFFKHVNADADAKFLVHYAHVLILQRSWLHAFFRSNLHI